jgi:hypothetical protein
MLKSLIVHSPSACIIDDFNGRVMQKSNAPEDPFIKIVWGSEKSELLFISKDELDSSQ